MTRYTEVEKAAARARLDAEQAEIDAQKAEMTRRRRKSYEQILDDENGWINPPPGRWRLEKAR